MGKKMSKLRREVEYGIANICGELYMGIIGKTCQNCNLKMLGVCSSCNSTIFHKTKVMFDV